MGARSWSFQDWWWPLALTLSANGLVALGEQGSRGLRCNCMYVYVTNKRSNMFERRDEAQARPNCSMPRVVAGGPSVMALSKMVCWGVQRHLPGLGTSLRLDVFEYAARAIKI